MMLGDAAICNIVGANERVRVTTSTALPPATVRTLTIIGRVIGGVGLVLWVGMVMMLVPADNSRPVVVTATETDGINRGWPQGPADGSLSEAAPPPFALVPEQPVCTHRHR